jgi:hypothetical protein
MGSISRFLGFLVCSGWKSFAVFFYGSRGDGVSVLLEYPIMNKLWGIGISMFLEISQYIRK